MIRPAASYSCLGVADSIAENNGLLHLSRHGRFLLHGCSHVHSCSVPQSEEILFTLHYGKLIHNLQVGAVRNVELLSLNYFIYRFFFLTGVYYFAVSRSCGDQ